MVKKLKVFSKKLNKDIVFSLNASGNMITSEGIAPDGDGVLLAWNNSAGSWMDKGWSNSGGNWMDNGWNNSGGNWMDRGWNNSSGRWMDKGWSNSAGNWGDSGGGSGCYLTTACVSFKGLADDCRELETLRRYRDRLVKEDDAFRHKVLEYYRKAPLIVQHIEKSGARDEILEGLYQNMILPCVALLESGRLEEAKILYLDSYEELVQKYLVG